MSLTTALRAELDAAFRDADAVSDDVLLSRSLKTVAENIVERHTVEPVRLHRVMIDAPRPTKMAVPGEPGHEEPGGSPLVVRGTGVELFVDIAGAKTMALAVAGDGERNWSRPASASMPSMEQDRGALRRRTAAGAGREQTFCDVAPPHRGHGRRRQCGGHRVR